LPVFFVLVTSYVKCWQFVYIYVLREKQHSYKTEISIHSVILSLLAIKTYCCQHCVFVVFFLW